jgi:hypothetical protein
LAVATRYDRKQDQLTENTHYNLLGTQPGIGRAVALSFIFIGDMLWKAPNAPLPPITSKAKTGFCYAGPFLIAMGGVNLLYGFITSEMFVSGRFGGYVGWMGYEGHKRAFVFFGFIYSFSIFFWRRHHSNNVLCRETKK